MEKFYWGAGIQKMFGRRSDRLGSVRFIRG